MEELLEKISKLLGGEGHPVQRDELIDGIIVEKWKHAFIPADAVIAPTFLAGTVAQEADRGNFIYHRLIVPADGLSTSKGTLAVINYAHLFNETTWDRVRNNTDATLGASAVRTNTLTVADQTNYNWRGVLIHLDLSVTRDGDHSGATIQVIVENKDPVSALYSPVLQSATFGGSVVTNDYLVYPGIADTGSEHTEIQATFITRTWRVRVVHSSSGPSFTYSVGASHLI